MSEFDDFLGFSGGDILLKVRDFGRIRQGFAELFMIEGVLVEVL